MVCKTVLLEFEWVMRGYYGFKADEILGVFQHLLSLEQLSIEDRHLVERALNSFAKGLDLQMHYTMPATTNAQVWFHLTIKNSPVV